MNVFLFIGLLTAGFAIVLVFLSNWSRSKEQTWLEGVQSAELDVESHGLSAAYHQAAVNGYLDDESAYCCGYMDMLAYAEIRGHKAPPQPSEPPTENATPADIIPDRPALSDS